MKGTRESHEGLGGFRKGAGNFTESRACEDMATRLPERRDMLKQQERLHGSTEIWLSSDDF